jgi:hypothetical protein
MLSNDTRTTTSRALIFCLSFCLAAVMWYAVSVSDMLEMQVELRLDYFGIPSNLIVTDGLVSKMTVRLRGPQMLLRSSNKEFNYKVVDLSNIKPGTTTIPLIEEQITPTLRAFEIIDAVPMRLDIKAEKVLERMVPVEPVLDIPLRRGAIDVKNVQVSPSSVMLRGPESVVERINSVKLPLRVDPEVAETTLTQHATLSLPQFVTSRPARVRVAYTVTSARVTLERTFPIRLEAVEKDGYTLEEAELTVSLEVPESLAKSPTYLRRLDVYVLPPQIERGQSASALVQFRAPEGMVVLGPLKHVVRVSRPAPESKADGEKSDAGGKKNQSVKVESSTPDQLAGDLKR